MPPNDDFMILIVVLLVMAVPISLRLWVLWKRLRANQADSNVAVVRLIHKAAKVLPTAGFWRRPAGA
jgi:hypothetical protein